MMCAERTSAVRPLRVLYFIGSYGPGVMGNASHEQTVLSLKALGHTVEVLTQVSVPGLPLYGSQEHSGVSVHSVNLAARGLPGTTMLRKVSARLLQYEFFWTLLRAYRRLLTKRHFDLVHVEGAYPFGFVAALGSGRTPFLVNVQGADVIDLPEADYGYRRYRLPRLAVKHALGRASYIRVISLLLRDYLISEGLAHAEKIAVIHRSIEDAAFPSRARELDDFRSECAAQLRAEYGLEPTTRIVIALSRLHPFKGLEYLIDAAAEVIGSSSGGGPPFHVLICGPSRRTEQFGDYAEYLRRRAEELGIAEHVTFTGQVEHSQVRRYLAGADVLVCPSILEAQNKVVPEAAAVGTPSVVTNTTGIAAYLAQTGACIEVPPRSAGAIAEALHTLLDDRTLYANTADNARAAAETLRAEVLAPQLESAWLRAARLPSRS